MKKNYLLATALALTALAGCTEDTFVGDENLKEANQGGAISFNMGTTAVTRAEGSEAATALSNQFIVYGEKDETSDGAAPATGKLVFQNYKVEYGANTAYTTTSNTKDWEYVGLAWTSDEQSHITTSTTDAQTIKYWDYGANSYTFTAVSALPADINDGKVSVTKTTSGTSVYDKGYTLTIGSGASLDKLYLADRVNIGQSADADRTATNKYGGNVTLTFRNILSHVRVGIYETIPGYDVSAISFKVTGDAAAENSSNAPAFGAICPNISATNYTGTLTVTYGDGATDIENRPIILAGTTASPTAAAADLILGTNINGISTSTLLNKTAASPRWDTDANNDGVGEYTPVIPLTHSTNLKLKCSYTLYNSVSGETINITDATAEIPFKYLQWKPNYKYTYIFKISDNTNGKTNPSLGPAGLYPITFDATETVAEDGQAEYITTISEPSITTFGVKSDKYTHDKDEYEAGSDIYVTIMDGSSVVETITLGSNVNVYLATTTDATTYPITEASVAESIAEVSAKTKQVSVELKNTDGTTSFTSAPAKATEVPGEDGKSLSTPVVVAASTVSDATGYYTDKACTVAATLTGGYLAAGTYFQKWTSALKLTGAVATTATTALVVEYIKTPATYKGQEVTIADATAFAAAKAAINLYTDAACTTAVGDATFDASAHYYKKVVDSPGVYAYKVIKVAAE